MEPTDLTVRLLREIRDSIRDQSDRFDRRLEAQDQRFEKMDQRFEKMDQRFEVIETALRDLAQQLVMLSHGIKTALESRAHVDETLGDHARRLTELEKHLGH